MNQFLQEIIETNIFKDCATGHERVCQKQKKIMLFDSHATIT